MEYLEKSKGGKQDSPSEKTGGMHQQDTYRYSPRKILDPMENVKEEENALSLEGMTMIQRYSEKLLTIFQNYCAYGEPMNTSKLKSSKFIKILKDSSLIQSRHTQVLFIFFLNLLKEAVIIPLQTVHADLIYSKITGIIISFFYTN